MSGTISAPTPAQRPTEAPKPAEQPEMPSTTPDTGLPSPEPSMPALPGLDGDEPTLPGFEPNLEPAAQHSPYSLHGMQVSASPSQANSGIITVFLPYEAKVEINGLATQSKGSRRQYVSYGLKPGLSYKYEIRAEVVRNGQLEEEVRVVSLTAGENSSVTFGFNPKPVAGLASR
jgi:uncharacterized protein (TIGR03000 family)